MFNKKNIILATTGILALFLFVLLAIVIKETEINDLDIRVSKAFSFWRPDWLTSIFKAITKLGSVAIGGFLAIMISIILWFQKKKIEALFLTMAIASVLMVDPLKVFFARPRPEASLIGFVPIEMGGFSFPSGHSILSTSVYGFLLVIIIVNLKGRLRIVASSIVVLVLILIGLSRIYLGAHYLSDVIGGLLLGSAWCTLLTILFLDTLDKKSNHS